MSRFRLLAACAAVLALHAADGPVVVTVGEASGGRSLDPAWFGSGSEYYCGGFIGSLKQPLAMAALRDTGIGFLRWPQGTSALWYFWDAPKQSYAQPWMAGFLAPADFVAAARELKSESLAQVNTCQFRREGFNDFESAKVLVAPGNIGQAAAYAARWVAAARADGAGIRWWEIGNEDWVYWTGRQHAAIAAAYAKAMRAADPDIRLLAQGFIGTWNSDWLHSEGAAWTGELAEALPAAAVDGVSVHLYLKGGHLKGVTRSVEAETAALFALVDRDQRLAQCRAQLAKAGRDGWQVWVTEYNLMQDEPSGPGGLLWWQNLAHALVLADWTGHLLEQGADRLAVHDLVGHPAFELVDVAHKASLAAPRLTAPALALQAFSREFGDQLLPVSTAANPARIQGMIRLGEAMTAHAYPAIGAWAARRSADGSLRVVLINRDLAAPVAVRLAGAIAALPAATPVTLRQLGAGSALSADDYGATAMAWSERATTLGGLAGLELPPHTITVLRLGGK